MRSRCTHLSHIGCAKCLVQHLRKVHAGPPRDQKFSENVSAALDNSIQDFVLAADTGAIEEFVNIQ